MNQLSQWQSKVNRELKQVQKLIRKLKYHRYQANKEHLIQRLKDTKSTIVKNFKSEIDQFIN